MGKSELMTIIEIGLIFSLVTLGVYLTYRMSDLPDLSVDGTFPLGAAISAKLLLAGISPPLAIILSIAGGAISGFITAYLHVKFKISALLSGIITMIALYSINLRIMGSGNLSFFSAPTVFSDLPKIGLLIGIAGLLIFALWYFLTTEYGLALRASGVNAEGSEMQGINTHKMKFTIYMLSNALVALAGSLYAQTQGFADISMGTGIIIAGIASLILGEALIKNSKVIDALLACLVGALLYRLVISLALHVNGLGLQASDLNLITALFVVIFMLLPKIKQKQMRRAIK
ncbi:MAG: ABC transporter permease [Candidatus Berkiellales bacterium]